MGNIRGGTADLPGIGSVAIEFVGNTEFTTSIRGTVVTTDGGKAQFRAVTIIDDAMRVHHLVDGCTPVIARAVPELESFVDRVLSDPVNETSLMFAVHDRARMEARALGYRKEALETRLRSMLHEHRRGTKSNGEPTAITREDLDRENARVNRLGKPLIDRISLLDALASELHRNLQDKLGKTFASIMASHDRPASSPLQAVEGVSLAEALSMAASGSYAAALPPTNPFMVMEQVRLPGRNVFYVTDGRGHSLESYKTDRFAGFPWQETVHVEWFRNGSAFNIESQYRKAVADGDILLIDLAQPSSQALDRLCSGIVGNGKDVIVVGFAPEATYVGTASAILAAMKEPVAEADMPAPIP